MNLDFLNNDFMSLQDTTDFEKKTRIQDGIADILNDRLNEETTRKAVRDNNDEVFKESLYMSAYEKNGTSLIDELLSEETEEEVGAVEDIFLDVLSECVINGLNINEDLIEDNRAGIIEKVQGVYNAFKEDINLNGSPVVFDLVTKCDECSKTCDIEKQGALYEQAVEIGELIKAKVGQVIKEEREISNLEKLNESAPTGVDLRLTLFKEMEIENAKAAIKEYSEDSRVDNESIMLMSFYETVVDYTILETFNTLKMLEFNKEMYNDISRRPELHDVEIEL